MPLSPSTLRRLSSRFSTKGIYDVSDSFAIAASCGARGDIFGREEWIDAAIKKLHGRGLPVPETIMTAYYRELGC